MNKRIVSLLSLAAALGALAALMIGAQEAAPPAAPPAEAPAPPRDTAPYGEAPAPQADTPPEIAPDETPPLPALPEEEEPFGPADAAEPGEEPEEIALAAPWPGDRTAEDLISITLDDVEIVDVVRMFTRISGANIIATPSNLQGRVTVNLTDVAWKPALESILDMHSLELREKTPGSGVYSIIRRPAGAPEPLKVQTVFLRYATVESVLPVVKAMLAPGASVSPYPSRNALVVRSTAANLGEIAKVVEEIDVLREQVYIEAKFMELNDQAIRDLGINWQVLQSYSISAGNLVWDINEQRTWEESRTDTYEQRDERSQLDKVAEYYDVDGVQYQKETITDVERPPGSGIFVTETTVEPTRTIEDTISLERNIATEQEDAFQKTITDIRTAVLGVDDFRLILSALKQMAGVSVVSNPKIIVANEEPAIIHIGQTERPFVSSVTPGQQGIAPVITYNPGEPVDIGVKLTVTPTVNTESNITVKIEPELTRFLRDAVAPNGQTYPVIAKKKIHTVFCLENGKTVAIGGLTETREEDKTTKVPLLGDIPLLGKYLFSHSHTEKAQSETIIFVTVGLAGPTRLLKETGLPENTELVRKRMILSEAERQQFEDALEEMRTAAEQRSARQSRNAKARLLKRRR